MNMTILLINRYDLMILASNGASLSGLSPEKPCYDSEAQ